MAHDNGRDRRRPMSSSRSIARKWEPLRVSAPLRHSVVTLPADRTHLDTTNTNVSTYAYMSNPCDTLYLFDREEPCCARTASLTSAKKPRSSCILQRYLPCGKKHDNRMKIVISDAFTRICLP